MGRIVIASLATLLLVAGGLFLWQGKAKVNSIPKSLQVAPPPMEMDDGLPEGDPDAVGDAPPMPGSASARTREQKRFDRYDRNRDGIITRNEMLSSRTKAFKKLDQNGDNLLSFEEWAVATADRFGEADANNDGRLTPAEFATTAPKRTPKPKCKC